MRTRAIAAHFDSVRELTAAIGRFINGWNDRCQPFTWTKAADEILGNAIHDEPSGTRHQVVATLRSHGLGQ